VVVPEFPPEFPEFPPGTSPDRSLNGSLSGSLTWLAFWLCALAVEPSFASAPVLVCVHPRLVPSGFSWRSWRLSGWNPVRFLLTYAIMVLQSDQYDKEHANGRRNSQQNDNEAPQ
jgi:hypothetical protein